MNLATPISAFLHKHGLENTPGIVAVSGGPDSVALAHALVGLLRGGKLQRLLLAHVNHQLRGDESDADEEFVRRLPHLWQMEHDGRLLCRTTRIDVATLAKAERENLESIARRERYQWFGQLAESEGANWIATGHSADDQAETVLFRLLRGSGVLGLGGIPHRRTLDERLTLIRPLLSLRRQALLDYLHAQGVPYRLDSSNLDTRYSRNRLRLELLPLLQERYNPAIVEVLCRLAEQAQDIHAENRQRAAQLLVEVELASAGPIRVFSVSQLQGTSPNLVREMFRLVWQRESWPMGDMNFGLWDRLVEIVEGRCSAWDFPGKIHARRLGKVVQIHGPTKK